MFGLALTVISFTWLAFTTNLVAAFLALLAIAFYVIVYTLLLKRSTPQNIVIGGAAGALLPLQRSSVGPPPGLDARSRVV